MTIHFSQMKDTMALTIPLCVVVVLATTASCMDSGLKTFLVNLHNNARAKEGSSDMNELVWDTQLEREAQDWADGCAFEHQMKERGENLAYSTYKKTDKELTQEAFDNWFKEKNDYAYGQHSCGTTGACHYTQLVWQQTRRVGCGAKRCAQLRNGEANAWYLVCFYDPKGNTNGQKPYLKGRSCSKCRDDQTCKKDLCSGGADPCEDSDNNCDMWANQMNQCTANKAFMKNKCALSCKFCTGGKSKGGNPTDNGNTSNPSGGKGGGSDCNDSTDRCVKWAERGECDRNPSYMKKSCRKSCNVCGGAKPSRTKKPQRGCRDKNRTCPRWARDNQCARNPGYMNRYCPLSCQRCDEVSECADRHGTCRKWAAFGHCTRNPRWMHRYCQLSCGRCQDVGDETQDCADNATGCRRWAGAGHCARNPGYMLLRCKRSCNVC